MRTTISISTISTKKYTQIVEQSTSRKREIDESIDAKKKIFIFSKIFLSCKIHTDFSHESFLKRCHNEYDNNNNNDKQILRHVLLFCSSFSKNKKNMFNVDDTHDYRKFFITFKYL